jgi:excisionase family DNA binding protein
MDKRELVSILRAAEICGVSRRTIYVWLDKGKIEAIRTAGGCVRIFTDSLFRDYNKKGKDNGN